MAIVRFSTRSHYGLRLLTSLAARGREPLALGVIAKSQHISRAYLEELATALKRKGIVASRKGLGGGYFLAKDPKKITVAEAIETLDGPLVNLECVSSLRARVRTRPSGQAPCCAVEKGCLSKSFWQKLQKDIERSLRSVTINDLIKKR